MQDFKLNNAMSNFLDIDTALISNYEYTIISDERTISKLWHLTN